MKRKVLNWKKEDGDIYRLWIGESGPPGPSGVWYIIDTEDEEEIEEDDDEDEPPAKKAKIALEPRSASAHDTQIEESGSKKLGVLVLAEQAKGWFRPPCDEDMLAILHDLTIDIHETMYGFISNVLQARHYLAETVPTSLLRRFRRDAKRSAKGLTIDIETESIWKNYMKSAVHVENGASRAS